MRNFWNVFRYEFARSFRRRGYLLTTFGTPVLFFAFFFITQAISATGGIGDLPVNTGVNTDVSATLRAFGMESGPVGYVDQTGRFGDPGTYGQALTPYADESEARAALDRGEIPAYFLIPENYVETGGLTIVQPRFNLNSIETDVIRSLIAERLASDVDPAVVERLLNPSNIRETNLTLNTRGAADEDDGAFDDGAFLLVYGFAILLISALFVTNGYLMQSVLEEKETRLIEILVASVRPWQLLGGKILAYGLLGLIQITIWTSALLFLASLASRGVMGQVAGIFQTVFSLELPFTLLPLLLAYFILSYLLFAGLYSIISALTSSAREGTQYTAIFIVPAMIPLYFTTLFASEPNGPLPVFFSLFPLTSPLAMGQRLIITQVPAAEIVASLALLALTVVAVMWIAGRLFRVQVLLAGQTPKLRDLPRLLRG